MRQGAHFPDWLNIKNCKDWRVICLGCSLILGIPASYYNKAIFLLLNLEECIDYDWLSHRSCCYSN